MAWAAAQPQNAAPAHLNDLSPVPLQPGALTVKGGMTVERCHTGNAGNGLVEAHGVSDISTCSRQAGSMCKADLLKQQLEALLARLNAHIKGLPQQRLGKFSGHLKVCPKCASPAAVAPRQLTF